MGCDIHVCREVRAKDGTWHALGQPNRYFDPDEENDPDSGSQARSIFGSCTGRDYALFGILSEGVRCEVYPNMGGERFPDDASPEVVEEARYGESNSDWHSHNYATLAELRELHRKCNGRFSIPGGDEKDFERDGFFIGWVNANMAPYAWDGEDSIRIVYWFDN